MYVFYSNTLNTCEDDHGDIWWMFEDKITSTICLWLKKFMHQTVTRW